MAKVGSCTRGPYAAASTCPPKSATGYQIPKPTNFEETKVPILKIIKILKSCVELFLGAGLKMYFFGLEIDV